MGCQILLVEAADKRSPGRQTGTSCNGVCESKPFVCGGCIMKCAFLVQCFLKQVSYIVQRAPRERVSKQVRFIVQRVPSCPANSRSHCQLVLCSRFKPLRS